MNTQTFSIRLAHFQAALRTVGLIALCVAAPIAAIAQQSSVAAETSSAKVSLAGLPFHARGAWHSARPPTRRGPARVLPSR